MEGIFELLIWVAIIVFSLLRAGQNNKKKKKGTAQSQTTESIDPIQEALREIELALKGESTESASPSAQSQEPAPSPIDRYEETEQTRRLEPEFHSMESSIPDRTLESKTRYAERYSEKLLESQGTYEDQFRTSSYYDDVFKHAHPDETAESTNAYTAKRSTSSYATTIRDRLRNKKDLAEAIILQEVLNRPSFKRRMR